MYLRKISISEEIPVKVKFEKIAEDLLMISVILETQCDCIPSYWRLVKVSDIPPLEIGVNREIQTLTSIVIFIDSTYITQFEFSKRNIHKGNILIDTSIFSKTNDYIDVNAGYNIAFENNTLVCLFERKR